METSFWHDRWARRETAWHESAPHPLLVGHFASLKLELGSRVFVPLCGKTVDIGWLLAGGYRVAGAELSETAINELFQELGVEPVITRVGKLVRYSARDIDIFVGNIFDLTATTLGPVDAIYDRAALVALPGTMREQYSQHLRNLTRTAPQLLITFEYNQQLMDGPPFSIVEAEVQQHYAAVYQLQALAHRQLPGGLKGKVPAIEKVWLLRG